jgi:hypothetical protein
MRSTVRVAVIGVVALALCTVAVGKVNKLPSNFVLEPIVTGLDSPSALAIAADGRVFIAERYTGNIQLVQNGVLAASPVLTLNVAGGADEGVRALAYDDAGNYLFVAYTEAATGDNLVVRYTAGETTLSNPFTIVNLGTSAGQTRTGGGLAIGNDGKLYVSTGDMEDGANAQNGSSLLGKVLRYNTDGSIPADNPTPGSAVYAMGFRDAAGLAVHPDVSTLYLTDRGPVGGFDEYNTVVSNGNYGWNLGTGPLGGGYDDPLNAHDPLIDPRGLEAYSAAHFPDLTGDTFDNDKDGALNERDENFSDSVYYTCKETNDIVRSSLIGANLDDQQGQCSIATTTQCTDDVDCPGGEVCVEVDLFFNASIEWDYEADTECPGGWTDLATGGDGMLYAVAEDPLGNLDGLYRIVYNPPGPREVSPTGTVLPLTIGKNGVDISLYWENVDRDAWVGTVTGSTQPAQKYTIWEGDLPIADASSYTHAVHTTTDGSALVDNQGIVTADITPGAGSHYYLVSAQGSNQEGPLGNGRPVTGKTPDYCEEIGWFDNEFGDATKETACNGIDDDGDGRIDESCPGNCGPDFVDGTGTPVRMLDQYGNYWTLHDFRGDVIHLDISALNCGYCRLEAQVYSDLYSEFKGRGFTTITVLMQSYNNQDAIPPANCASEIQWWIDNFAPGTDKPVLCAVDEGGEVGRADIWEQYGEFMTGDPGDRCNGTPANLYFDQGLVMYDAICGKFRGECQLWKCDGDDADCNVDADCVGHGGTETCDKSPVEYRICSVSGNPCETTADCPFPSFESCVTSSNCHEPADCTPHGGRVCWHQYDRDMVEQKLTPERCE